MPVTALQAATNVLDRADALLALDVAGALGPVREDVRRMAWAMGSAAIDTYMHWRVRGVDLDSPVSRRLQDLDIPLSELIVSGKKSVTARRKGKNDRPTVRTRNALAKRSLQDSYQTRLGVESAMALVGAKKYWTPVAASLNETTQAVYDRLNRIAYRRNKIVHEGDILRKSKPQTVKHESLAPAEVRRELAWIRDFLVAIDAHT